MTSVGIGIDIGGSGIKGALVDLDQGEFIGERVRIDTPQPSTPDAVAATCEQIIAALGGPEDAAIGIAMPAPMKHDVIGFMANLDQGWVGLNAREVYEKHLGRPVVVMNDADAAGIAEYAFGAAKDEMGTIIVTTLGTGIGTALIYDGILVPNTELGHVELDGHDAETQASAKQRKQYELSWEEWGSRLNRYYQHLEMLFSPDLIVVGGGVSKNYEYFFDYIKLRDAKIVPAKLFNTAGIVGAAYYADRQRG